MYLVDILNLIRIKDWLKNIIIFLPLIFSGQFFNFIQYPSLMLGFLTFSIVSSFIYVLNDILDINKDRIHPTKKFDKPLANNKISIKFAYFILSVLAISSLILTFNQPVLQFSIFCYLCLSLSYNFGLKKIPFLELIILAAGYIIRTDSGSLIISVDSSFLMLFSIFLLALYFILTKRLSELNHDFDKNQYNTRIVLKYYKESMLRLFSLIAIITLSIVMLIYILTINIKLIISFLFVLLFITKYHFLIKNTSDGEYPIAFIISNKLLLSLSIIIILTSFIIYI